MVWSYTLNTHLYKKIRTLSFYKVTVDRLEQISEKNSAKVTSISN